jgi:hypothetical protein
VVLHVAPAEGCAVGQAWVQCQSPPLQVHSSPLYGHWSPFCMQAVLLAGSAAGQAAQRHVPIWQEHSSLPYAHAAPPPWPGPPVHVVPAVGSVVGQVWQRQAPPVQSHCSAP